MVSPSPLHPVVSSSIVTSYSTISPALGNHHDTIAVPYRKYGKGRRFPQSPNYALSSGTPSPPPEFPYQLSDTPWKIVYQKSLASVFSGPRDIDRNYPEVRLSPDVSIRIWCPEAGSISLDSIRKYLTNDLYKPLCVNIRSLAKIVETLRIIALESSSRTLSQSPIGLYIRNRGCKQHDMVLESLQYRGYLALDILIRIRPHEIHDHSSSRARY